MASFQILDLPFEEDLSDEQAMSIDAGQGALTNLVNSVLDVANQAVTQGFLTAQQAIDGAYAFLADAVATCQASADPAACLNELDKEIL